MTFNYTSLRSFDSLSPPVYYRPLRQAYLNSTSNDTSRNIWAQDDGALLTKEEHCCDKATD